MMINRNKHFEQEFQGAIDRGFTLIELLITMVIIGILASIALGSFQQYVLKSRRIDATTTLMKLAVAQEKYFNQHLTYSNDISSSSGLNQQSLLSDESYYQLSVEVKIQAADGIDSFKVSATAISSQSKDKQCQLFSINHLNVQQAFNSQNTINSDCWL
ncbi:type IV pilin protein [Colwelliaceae bacterium BS250]